MGAGRWDAGSWAATRSAYTAHAAPTVDHIYRSKTLDPLLDPRVVTLRQSRDSAANPNSTAIILGLDVTGSMDRVLDAIARQGLGTLVGELYSRQPVTDPHIMVMGIGDFECDHHPLQVSQFEAENQPLITQMEKIYLERGGGGNHHESYAAAWWFAATRTAIDCFEQRGKRGLLFTIGDEEPTPALFGEHMQRHLSGDFDSKYPGDHLLQMAQATYDVFHIMVEEGSHFRSHGHRVRSKWNALLGQHAIPLVDHRKLAEVVVSAIQVAGGANRDDVIRSWSGDTSVVVANAIGGLPATRPAAPGMNLSY
jgi:hypothetical protein